MTTISDLINSLPALDKELLDEQIVNIHLTKKEFACEQWTLDHSIYYVESGILRKYILKDGVEKTLDFYFTDELYFPHEVSPTKPTGCFLQAIANSHVYKINLLQFETLKANSTKLLELENKVLELALSHTAARLQKFQTMSATEMYLDLLEKNPEIVQNIPLIYVASYLGINNASLSKIRSTLK